MKTLKLVKNMNGNFDIRKFGVSTAGNDGKNPFILALSSPELNLHIEIVGVTIQDIFCRFDINGDHFGRDLYFRTNFVSVTDDGNTIGLKVTKAFIEAFRKFQKQGKISYRSAAKLFVIGPKAEAITLNSNQKI